MPATVLAAMPVGALGGAPGGAPGVSTTHAIVGSTVGLYRNVCAMRVVAAAQNGRRAVRRINARARQAARADDRAVV